jgi:MCP family monocarboxylic acid transporter-like MFS transporter 3
LQLHQEAMATTTDVEFRTILRSDNINSWRSDSHEQDNSLRGFVAFTSALDESPENVTAAAPEGGYGWAVITSCAILTFWVNGLMGSWGVLQVALLRSKLLTTSTSTASFIVGLGLACIVAFGLFGVTLARLLGARITALLGILFVAIGEISSSFTTTNIGGMFGCSGVILGLGACLCYSVSNILPPHYFVAKIGLASGIVKLGGGIGAAILSIAIDAMIRHIGIEWTFRVLGLCILATGIPAACVIRERVPINRAPFLDLSMFRHLSFTAIFLAGAIGVFCMFVPPYFLPLVAHSVGLSSTTGAGLVAGFNACTAIGRFMSGWLSDYTGPVNMFLLAMVLNAVSMLAIWPVSNSFAPLLVFALLNGLANGAFFTLYPVVVASTAAAIGRGDVTSQAVAMGMGATGWTGGYLMGVPIAGYLLESSGVGKAVGSNPGAQENFGTSIAPYRPAIFYAGGVALASAGFVLVARVKLGRGGKKKV